MRLLIGLGNPGSRYVGTRHNLGFEVVERIAQEAGATWRRWSRLNLVAEAELAGSPVLLVKPQGYMNRSGWAVAELVESEGLQPGEVLVLLDDVALPLGALRIRPRGSDGGHRGLESVLRALGDDEVPRVRLGIAPGYEPADLSDFVLESFTPEERVIASEVVERAGAATRMILVEGIAKAMSVFNQTPCSS